MHDGNKWVWDLGPCENEKIPVCEYTEPANFGNYLITLALACLFLRILFLSFWTAMPLTFF